MKRKFLRIAAAVLATLLLTSLVVRSSPALRTRAYFSLHRSWRAHWPFQRGSLPPRRLRSMFLPFVPVRIEVEPLISMQLDPEDLVSRAILETGQWESDSWRKIEEHLPLGGTFVDVGAHIGYYSLKAARVVGPTGHVIAIEPNPQTVKTLTDNIRASGARVVAVQPVACTDSEGMLDLFLAARTNTGETSLSRSNASQSGAVVAIHRVRTRRLDDIIQETAPSRVDAIKIDVEGAEFLVLKGARQTLMRYSPTLIVELVDKQLRSMGTTAAEVTEFLGSLGYTPRQQLGMNTEFER